jgi:hypothetical protein
LYFIEGKVEMREDEEEDVSSCWVTFRKEEGAGSLKKKHHIALSENSLWKRL